MVYNSDYYEDTTIERLIRHYKTLLANLLKDPHRLIDTVSPVYPRRNSTNR